MMTAMPNFRSDNPMATRPQQERERFAPEDVRETFEGETRVAHYRDGSSTYHFGGPCAPVSYDANGEEKP